MISKERGLPKPPFLEIRATDSPGLAIPAPVMLLPPLGQI
jgi:hypothetical protein